MKLIPQCKGKDFDKAKNIPTGDWYFSKKYDGNYVQIHINYDEVKFFTSGGKEFYIKDLAEELKGLQTNVILECEYIAHTEGNLGDRRYAAKLTSLRTMFSKGLEYNQDNDRFVVFDYIPMFRGACSPSPFKDRVFYLESLIGKLPDAFIVAKHHPVYIANESDFTQLYSYIGKGEEGIYLKHAQHTQRPGKRVNDALKLKTKYTADLLCTGVLLGEGKYEGMIGSLELVNAAGLTVRVGTGLDDAARSLPHSHFVGKIIEIGYEQILDTYIHPVFVRIRDDK